MSGLADFQSISSSITSPMGVALDGSDAVDVDNAKLIIVVCSAFAKYLVARAANG
jgi:hypothetical protein